MRGGRSLFWITQLSVAHQFIRETEKIFCRKFDQIHSESRSINTKGIASGPRLIIHDLSS